MQPEFLGSESSERQSYNSQHTGENERSRQTRGTHGHYIRHQPFQDIQRKSVNTAVVQPNSSVTQCQPSGQQQRHYNRIDNSNQRQREELTLQPAS